MSDKITIYSRTTPKGRTTYWSDSNQGIGIQRIPADRAKELVFTGKAEWFDPRSKTHRAASRRRKTSAA